MIAEEGVLLFGVSVLDKSVCYSQLDEVSHPVTNPEDPAQVVRRWIARTELFKAADDPVRKKRSCSAAFLYLPSSLFFSSGSFAERSFPPL